MGLFTSFLFFSLSLSFFPFFSVVPPAERGRQRWNVYGVAIDTKLVRCQIELKAFPLSAANSTSEHRARRIVGQIYIWKIVVAIPPRVWENICSYFAHRADTMEPRETGEKEYVHTCVAYLLLTKSTAASDSSIFPRRRVPSNVTGNIRLNVCRGSAYVTWVRRTHK